MPSFEIQTDIFSILKVFDDPLGDFSIYKNVWVCNDHGVSEIFRIGGKIFQVEQKLTRWGKNPPSGHKRDSKMWWVQLLTSTIDDNAKYGRPGAV